MLVIDNQWANSMSSPKQIERNKIIFIGGAHNVGKSTALEELKKLYRNEETRVNIVHMSEILHNASMKKYSMSIVELNEDSIKRDTLQLEVVSSLRGLNFAFTLLDGHYITTNTQGGIGPSYNTDVNYLIKFDAQVVLIAKPEEILARRIKKNQGIWSINLDSIRQEQDMEISEANRIGRMFNTPVYAIEDNEPKDTAKAICKLLKIPNT
ncbi:MAG: AAA family ATPase [Candidatus Parvarchaeum sp.]